MPKYLTDTGNPNAVQTVKTTVYNTAGGQRVEEYAMAPGDVASFKAGTLAPFTSSAAPFAYPAAQVEERLEDGIAYITITRDFGYNNLGGVIDPTSDDLSVQVEVVFQERRESLSQIPYLKTNLITSFPDATGQTEANLLKNIRLRVLHELLAMPQSQRPGLNDSFIPSVANIIPDASPAWAKFLEKAGTLDGITLNDTHAISGADKFNFGRDDGTVESNPNEAWNLPIPIAFLLGGNSNGTPAALLNGGSSWPEWDIYAHAYKFGIEQIFQFDYILRKNTTRSSAYATQQSLVNVGKAIAHANIFAEIGVASGSVKFSFSSFFTGGYWIKMAPNIRWLGGGNFQIQQDYLFLEGTVFNSYFYATA